LNWQQIIGIIAGILIAASFVPQIWRLFRLKSANEVSLPFTILQLCAGIIWLVYGITLSLLAVIVTNIINIALVSVLLYAKLKFSK
jgi:MtN3 and saliva related transmembrane protein